ncbi:MAG: cytochrome c peroxidase, partial [Campylobacterota bacterium]|nr:cytochrome c peroxidase [Campylobacterota bacterium]
MKPILYSSALLSLLLLGGCGSSNQSGHIGGSTQASALDKNLSPLISHLTGDPSTGHDIPSIDDPKAQLGMKLNYTKTMSLPGDTACVSCHHPLLGGGDGVQIAIGTGAVDTDIYGYDRVLDPGKYAPYHEIEGGPSQAVNSPTHYNSALQDRFMAWHGIIEAADPIPGKNGSVGGLYDPDSEPGYPRIKDPSAGADVPATQARFPVQNPVEMANFDDRWNDLDSFGIRQLLLERFTGDGNSGKIGSDYLTPEQRAAWQKEFKDAGVELNDANIYNMISYFEQTILLIENPWKKYVEGDLTAISEDAKKGAILFFSSYEQGGANCTHCHNGDF